MSPNINGRHVTRKSAASDFLNSCIDTIQYDNAATKNRQEGTSNNAITDLTSTLAACRSSIAGYSFRHCIIDVRSSQLTMSISENQMICYGTCKISSPNRQPFTYPHDSLNTP
ncbi:hypothetical protein NEUTE1DRAFT_107643 [Neurospora tetrasperma FGSC 2508]|uniref:Uncharacterized protein n=1 Tax=Neurospora tetrasperma (strain FGSC 2508 / ATCC MYA-4615 / P0657) TaxID=510951 RepID=F8MBC5_NEUT8|nr:uncharacterized protein NEUTE1DRAFT_107643 [Neurospora tetrasperma FGSC 2508]EGO61090.1 hypothetical protein NEUTE1DRAFT_107643 [Neurospora tetrasperma FGSC 2508]EGZ74905.1 hypothetical protein NEUTE2DRAFT_57488 [Neurospora tetrasperma FGSC 2509]